MTAMVTVIFYGILALLLCAGGIYAIKSGSSLFRDGVGLKKEGSSWQIEGKGFKLSITTSSVGAVLMLTAVIWGWLAKEAMPTYQKDGEMVGKMVSVIDKNITKADLEKVGYEAKDLLGKNEEELSQVMTLAANARDTRIAKENQIVMENKDLTKKNRELSNELSKLKEENKDKLPSMHEDDDEKKLTSELKSIGPIRFDIDSYKISDAYKNIIEKWVKIVKDHPDKYIVIEGHASDEGESIYNLTLGFKRAMAIKDKMIKYGINRERIILSSYGEEMAHLVGSSNNRRGLLKFIYEEVEYGK